MRARYLADKSALARMPLEPVRQRLAPILFQNQEVRMKPSFFATWVLGLGVVLFLSPVWAKHVPTVTEFSIPTTWRHALHMMSPPPGFEPERYEATVKVGFDGSPLFVLQFATEFFDANTPAAGSAWLELGKQRFKLHAPPAPGEPVLLRLVPLFSVLTGVDTQARRFSDPIREPRKLSFVEA